MCQDAIEQSKVPGIVALVARHGEIIFHRAYGMADNQAKRVLQKDDVDIVRTATFENTEHATDNRLVIERHEIVPRPRTLTVELPVGISFKIIAVRMQP